MATKCFTKQPVSLKDLEEGTEFEIDHDALNSSSEDEYFDDEVSNTFKDELAKLSTGELENEIDLSSLSINDLMPKMTQLTEDGKVRKLVVKEGVGLVIPTKAIVLMHYNASVENQNEPFDSTYRRGNPHKFLLNAGRVISGLDIAVSTMRKGEVSKVWVHFEYAYGSMGCPPRIPAEANIVYNIEILNFIESKDAIEYEEMAPEDQKKAPFEKVYSVSTIEHQMGNDLFNHKKYPSAVARYQKARKLLEEVSVANEEEDNKRNQRLLKLYINLSFCFIKLKSARRAIFFGKKALDIDQKNTKAMYRLGLAYQLDSEFDLAKKYLLMAKAREPYNEEINAALLKLEDKCKAYAAWNKDFCKKVFQSNSEKKEESSSHFMESPEFIQVINDRIEIFKSSDDREYAFSSGFTPNQIDAIKAIARKHDLHLIEKIHDNQRIIKILKKNC